MKINEVTNQSPRKIYEADVTPPEPGFFSKLGSALKSGLKLFTYYEALWSPFATYITNMKVVEANLAKAGNTPAAIERFNTDHEMQMGQLIAGLASGLLVKTILGSVGVFGKFLTLIPGIGPIIGRSIEMLSLSAQAWVLAELQSEKARTEIAKLLVISGIHIGFLNINYDFGQAVNVTQLIGRLGVEAHDYFEDLFRRALGLKALDKPLTGNEQPDPNAPPPAAPLTPEQDKSLMATLFGTNQPVEKELPVPGEYLGPKLQRNPTTGKIEMKPLQ